jgi:YHS domain-containing protein
MKKGRRLTIKEKVNIIEGYKNNLIPMIELAKCYDVTRTAIYKTLKKAGVDTKKGLIEVSCSNCNSTIPAHKSRIRNQKYIFCDRDCYINFLKNNNYIQSRHGQRIARQIISEHFNLGDKMVCHHEDGNCLNNDINNLRVFHNQGDHIRYHRGFDVNPIWNGRSLGEA